MPDYVLYYAAFHLACIILVALVTVVHDSYTRDLAMEFLRASGKLLLFVLIAPIFLTLFVYGYAVRTHREFDRWRDAQLKRLHAYLRSLVIGEGKKPK
jgi:hypothetical protein